MRHRDDAILRRELTPVDVCSVGLRKRWTLLFYLCGDNDILDGYMSRALAELGRIGASPQMHIVVQCDRREGRAGTFCRKGRPRIRPAIHRWTTCTSTPATRPRRSTFCGGASSRPSDHVAVVFSGLGINPAYVQQLLMPQDTRTALAEKPSQRIQERLFSICHDQTSHDALEAHEFSEILQPITEALARPIDLVGLDMGVAAFVEIAYQIQGLAGILVASQRPLPDAGWPYDKIMPPLARAVSASQSQARRIWQS